MSRRLAWFVGILGCGRLDFDARIVGGEDGSGDTGGPSGLVAYYPFETLVAISLTTPDATGHGHTAQCAAGGCPTLVPGMRGSAAELVGPAEPGAMFVVPGSQAFDPAGGFTVAGWIDLVVGTSTGCAFTMGLGSGVSNTWALCFDGTGVPFFFTVTGAAGDSLTAPSPFPTGAWHHAAITWDHATKVLWLDGAAIATDAAAAVDFDGSPVYLGNDVDNGSPVSPMTGGLDEVRIYDRALSASELAELMML